MSTVGRLVREPLLQFLALGLLLFVGYQTVHRTAAPRPGVSSSPRLRLGVRVEPYALGAAPYAIGTLAAFWFFERLAKF